MALNRMTVIAVAGLIVATTPVYALPPVPIVSQVSPPNSQLESIQYYRRSVRNGFPAALFGGLVAGMVGGAMSGGCYFNDCGYEYGSGYYNGGYYSGGPYYGGYNGGYGGGYNRGYVGGRGHVGGGRRWTGASPGHK